jgi:hypothetical protein
MKNTLLAVLIMCLCYDHTQAQNVPPHAADYIKYQERNPNQPVGKSSVATNTLADGVVSTDKLFRDINTSTIMADGAITTDKLADDIINSLNEMEDALGVNKQPQRVIPVSFIPLNNIVAIDQHAYAWHMQCHLLYARQSQKPRPTHNRIGWLPY